MQPNNIGEFLRYAQSLMTNLPTQQLNALKQKYPKADAQQLALQRAQAMGITPAQITQAGRQLGIIQ